MPRIVKYATILNVLNVTHTKKIAHTTMMYVIAHGDGREVSADATIHRLIKKASITFEQNDTGIIQISCVKLCHSELPLMGTGLEKNKRIRIVEMEREDAMLSPFSSVKSHSKTHSI